MTKTIEIDDATYSSVAELAAAQNLTVEEWLQKQLDKPKGLVPFELHNPSHRKISAALANMNEGRDEIYDRDKGRAEVYAENRRRLIDLIETSPGDMGADGWSRERSYER